MKTAHLIALTLATSVTAALAQQQETATTQPTSMASEATTQPSARAEANRAYFKQVSEVIDRVLTQPAAKAVPSLYTNSANKIAQLPKENVDPDVIAWGGTVALALTNAANALDVGKQRAESRADSVGAPIASDAQDPNRQERSRADVQNVQQARRQAALDERANASEQVANLLANLQDNRTKVAAQITQRYGVGQP